MNLKSLNISYCNRIDDNSIIYLSNLKYLTALDITNCTNITSSKGIYNLKLITNMQKLLIGNINIRSKDLKSVTCLNDLITLALDNCNIMNSHLIHLTNNIINLSLNQNNQINESNLFALVDTNKKLCKLVVNESLKSTRIINILNNRLIHNQIK